jgi:hypothetical protein
MEVERFDVERRRERLGKMSDSTLPLSTRPSGAERTISTTANSLFSV